MWNSGALAQINLAVDKQGNTKMEIYNVHTHMFVAFGKIGKDEAHLTHTPIHGYTPECTAMPGAP